MKVMPGASLSCTKRKISNAQKNNRDVNRNLSVLPPGKPLLLSSLDQMVQKFLLSLFMTGGVVFSAVSISAAKALVAQYRPGPFTLGAKLVSENGLQKTNVNYG